MSASTSNGTSLSDPLEIVMDSTNSTNVSGHNPTILNDQQFSNTEQFTSWADAVEEATTPKSRHRYS